MTSACSSAKAKGGRREDKARRTEGRPQGRCVAAPAATERARKVQLPRFAYTWLVGDEARGPRWTVMDLGLLAALLGAFANDDPRLIRWRPVRRGGHRSRARLPGGVGSDLRLFGKVAGSAIETGGSGHVRVRAALATLARNKWITIELSASEMRIRLGERALKLAGDTPA